MQEFNYLKHASAGDQRQNFGYQVKLFGYEFLASSYLMVAISEDSSPTAPFLVVFCRTRKIRVDNIIVTVTLNFIQKSSNFSISLFILMLILSSYVSFFY